MNEYKRPDQFRLIVSCPPSATSTRWRLSDRWNIRHQCVLHDAGCAGRHVDRLCQRLYAPDLQAPQLPLSPRPTHGVRAGAVATSSAFTMGSCAKICMPSCWWCQHGGVLALGDAALWPQETYYGAAFWGTMDSPNRVYAEFKERAAELDKIGF